MSKFQGTSSNWLEEVTKHEICIPTLGGPLFLWLILVRFPLPTSHNASNTVIYNFKAFYFWDSSRSLTETMNKPVGRLVSDVAESGVAARSTQYRPALPPPAPGSLHPDRAAPTPPCADTSPPLHRSFHFSALRSTKL